MHTVSGMEEGYSLLVGDLDDRVDLHVVMAIISFVKYTSAEGGKKTEFEGGRRREISLVSQLKSTHNTVAPEPLKFALYMLALTLIFLPWVPKPANQL